MIPSEVAAGVCAALGEVSPERAFAKSHAIGGGCIDPAVRVCTASGNTAFLKWSKEPGRRGFDIEAGGLTALSHASGPRVPEVLAFEAGGAATRGWILLELIEVGRPTAETPGLLGRGLARLHHPLEDCQPGWEEDGFIGSLPQRNRAGTDGWPEFWREKRLLPQWESAEPYFDGRTQRAWDELMEQIGPILCGWETDGLSLLHGDLWSGNVLTDRQGEPVLVDPAVYRGHREVDLAMMELFGGFDGGVIEEYLGAAPLADGYLEFRRDLYQLYPLLVHVNLFGTAYTGGVRERVGRLLDKFA